MICVRGILRMDEIHYIERPVLQQPTMIVGFEGWPNAASISSLCMEYLIAKLGARKFASMASGNFYQTSLARPVATIKEGRLTELKFPGNEFYYSKGHGGTHAILFLGIEPHFRWSAFVDQLLTLAEQLHVSQILTLGGTYDYVPHTTPPVVSAVFNHSDLKEKVLEAGLALTEYTGPISVHTFILEAGRKRGMKVVGLWGHAPQYLQTQNARVAHSVLEKLVDLIGLHIDLSELHQTAAAFDEQVNRLLEEDPKLKEAIHQIENVHRQLQKPSPELRKQEDVKKEEKVVYIQAFLKKPEDEGKKDY